MAERRWLSRKACCCFFFVVVSFYFARASFVSAFLPMPLEHRVIAVVLIAVGIVLSTKMLLSEVRDGKSTKDPSGSTSQAIYGDASRQPLEAIA